MGCDAAIYTDSAAFVVLDSANPGMNMLFNFLNGKCIAAAMNTFRQTESDADIPNDVVRSARKRVMLDDGHTFIWSDRSTMFGIDAIVTICIILVIFPLIKFTHRVCWGESADSISEMIRMHWSHRVDPFAAAAFLAVVSGVFAFANVLNVEPMYLAALFVANASVVLSGKRLGPGILPSFVCACIIPVAYYIQINNPDATIESFISSGTKHVAGLFIFGMNYYVLLLTITSAWFIAYSCLVK